MSDIQTPTTPGNAWWTIKPDQECLDAIAAVEAASDEWYNTREAYNEAQDEWAAAGRPMRMGVQENPLRENILRLEMAYATAEEALLLAKMNAYDHIQRCNTGQSQYA